MPGSVTSVFSEPEDFEAALREEGCLDLLITGRGQFRAQLTQIALHRLRLSAAEEQLSRIAFITVPADMILMAFPIGGGTAPIWCGVRMRAGEMMTVGPGQRLHTRTDGLCHWGAIRLPVEEFVRYGRALTGAPIAVPSVARCWRPPSAGRDLRKFHGAAIRMAHTQPKLLVDAEAARGLEQQLIHAVIECCLSGSAERGISSGSAERGISSAHRHRDIMGGFEDLLQSQRQRHLRVAEICVLLGVSDRTLRSLCAEHLGQSPSSYLRLRRAQRVHRALRSGSPNAATVAEVARRYGVSS